MGQRKRTLFIKEALHRKKYFYQCLYNLQQHIEHIVWYNVVKFIDC